MWIPQIQESPIPRKAETLPLEKATLRKFPYPGEKKKKKHNSSPHSTHLTIKEAQMEEAVYSQGVTSRVGMGR